MPTQISSNTCELLEGTLLADHVSKGFALLDSLRESLLQLNPNTPDAIRLLLALAHWIDLGYGDLDLLRRVRSRFDRIEPSLLSIMDFLTLRAVDGLIAMMSEHLSEAAELVELIPRLGQDILPWNVIFLTHVWKGRIHRKRGEYELARTHIQAAKRYAAMTDAPKLLAICKMHESWILFQNGANNEALRLLDEAEEGLKDSGQVLALANIQSSRGRIVRRFGKYQQALRHFEAAIDLYSSMPSQHVNLARTLMNAARVKRLISLELRPSSTRVATGSVHAQCQKLTREALELLEAARRIFEAHHHDSGLGSMLVNAGYLHLEAGNAIDATTEAERALELGHEVNDSILMARACNLWSAVELVTADDAEDQTSAAAHRTQAQRLAEQAIELATHTQNRRVLAEACIRRGAVAVEDTPPDYETAREFASRAATLVGENDRDSLFQELSQLKQRILRANGINETLRLWSNGELGNKTFLQIEEEFAEIVISRVWRNLGKNTTRVAEQLSISPKKVRRALKNITAKEVDGYS